MLHLRKRVLFMYHLYFMQFLFEDFGSIFLNPLFPQPLCPDDRLFRFDVECVTGEGMLWVFPRADCNPFAHKLGKFLLFFLRSVLITECSYSAFVHLKKVRNLLRFFHLNSVSGWRPFGCVFILWGWFFVWERDEFEMKKNRLNAAFRIQRIQRQWCWKGYCVTLRLFRRIESEIWVKHCF